MDQLLSKFYIQNYKNIPGLGRIFSPCHGGGILCLSVIMKPDTKPDTNVSTKVT